MVVFHCRGTISQTDYEDLQDICDELIKMNAPFKRIEMKKEQALDMFRVSPSSPNVLVCVCVCSHFMSLLLLLLL